VTAKYQRQGAPRGLFATAELFIYFMKGNLPTPDYSRLESFALLPSSSISRIAKSARMTRSWWDARQRHWLSKHPRPLLMPLTDTWQSALVSNARYCCCCNFFPASCLYVPPCLPNVTRSSAIADKTAIADKPRDAVL